jgi:succinate dehydrogenase/fumarate reductase iron-sulfur protein
MRAVVVRQKTGRAREALELPLVHSTPIPLTPRYNAPPRVPIPDVQCSARSSPGQDYFLNKCVGLFKYGRRAPKGDRLRQALHYINEQCEPVAFDYSCRGSLCGRCSITLDGQAALSCYAPLSEADHTIESLQGFPVLHDLIVDRDVFMGKLTGIDLSVKTTKSLELEDLPAIDYDFWWETLNRLQMCRECGNCMTVCPVYAADAANFAGPSPLSQVALRMYDGVDQADRALQAYEMGINSCIECGLCETVCPSYIAHASLHAKMKETVAEKGYTA